MEEFVVVSQSTILLVELLGPAKQPMAGSSTLKEELRTEKLFKNLAVIETDIYMIHNLLDCLDVVVRL